MVEAIEVHTTGIGGDSEVRFDEKGKMIIGPRRVVPLNLLASQYPGIVEALKDQNAAYEKKGASDLKDLAGRFIMCQRPLWTRKETLSSMHQEIWELLNDVPIAFSELQRKIKYPALYKKSLYELVDQGLVIVSAFTPTDALHVLGKYQNGSIEAAELGARLLSNQLYLNIKDFCEKVAAQVSIQVGQAVIKTQLTQEGISLSDHDKAAMLFMDRMLGADDGKGFSASFKLKNPLVAIGAPVKCYIPWVGSKFNTHVYISEHAAVGNAVGAASGSIIQSVRILIRPFDGGRLYRAYLPSGIRDFTDLSDAVSCAKDIAHRLAEYHAVLAGAKMAHVQVEQHDRILQDSGKWLDEAYFETEVVAVAVGRPQAVT
jgi:N-methylhydantoinase A/oxoprolinase/acetone carboxylase beta subunit